jgi:hypothetical protein
MMRATKSVSLGIVFLVGCAVGGASSHFVAPPARAAAPNPATWEHYCIRGSSGISDKANKLGAEGWEMAAAAGAGAGDGVLKEMEFVFCFKRPR